MDIKEQVPFCFVTFSGDPKHALQIARGAGYCLSSAPSSDASQQQRPITASKSERETLEAERRALEAERKRRRTVGLLAVTGAMAVVLSVTLAIFLPKQGEPVAEPSDVTEVAVATQEPTATPTKSPTETPAQATSQAPTEAPTEAPTQVPAAVTAQQTEEPIVITKQPENWVGEMGQEFSISVIAKGEGLTYQWYFRNYGEEDFRESEETDNTYGPYQLTALRNRRELYCEIEDYYGNHVITDPVLIISEVPQGHTWPVITSQPKDWVGPEGEYPVISVAAEGIDLTYQWYIMDEDDSYFRESEEVDNSYDSYPMTQERDGRQLYCVITDKYNCSITSHKATMRIG